jgi:hypothetical protein
LKSRKYPNVCSLKKNLTSNLVSQFSSSLTPITYEMPEKILAHSLQEEYRHKLSKLLCIQERKRHPETMELYNNKQPQIL